MKKTGTKNISYEQKKEIQKMLAKGISVKNIASSIGVSDRTVYGEIKKGTANGKYSAKYSSLMALYSNKNKGKPCKLGIDKELANYISKLILEEKLSIIQVEERCKREAIDCPSRTTLYNAIDKGLIPGVNRNTLHSNITTIFSNGLIQIPKYMRTKLNLKDKDIVNIEMKNEKIIITKNEMRNR